MSFLHLSDFGVRNYIGAMEMMEMKDDILLMTVKADHFPEGIQEAFDKLKLMLPPDDRRTPYGISKPERNGTIIYRAGVKEAFSGEAESRGCETVTLRKGTYIVETITGWQSKIESITTVFESLVVHPQLDPETLCIEVYQSQTELICMVRIVERNSVAGHRKEVHHLHADIQKRRGSVVRSVDRSIDAIVRY